MLTASDYRKRSRKTITLPSGGEVEIRKLSALDFLRTGDIPQAFWLAASSGDRVGTERSLKENREIERKIMTATLINGVVSMTIVDKRPRECGDDEVSVDEISPEDSDFIVKEISALNSMNAGAGKSIRRFPEESGSSCDGGRDSGQVREVANGDTVS